MVLAQTAVPVSHWVVPVTHGLGLVVHDEAATHALQVPLPLQTPVATLMVMHADPALRAAPFTHVGVPLEQSSVPWLQTLGFVEHELPATHATQLPLPLQTPAPPIDSVQPVPGPFGAPLTQTLAPVAHETTPSKHESGLVVHVAPEVQATQVAMLLHTPASMLIVVHEVPTVLDMPSTHVGVPDIQLSVPAAQGLGFVPQAEFATQAMQTPEPSHTPDPPQTLAPVAHETTPSKHESGLVVHEAPWVQGRQLPPLQTPLPPPLAMQAVPASFGIASTQARPDALHCSVPRRQAEGLSVHRLPVEHATQVNPTHTPPSHAVPAGTMEMLVHWAPPLPHMVSPAVHSEGLHTVPAVHARQFPVASHTPPGQRVPAGLMLC
jgi:hypothetical protein